MMEGVCVCVCTWFVTFLGPCLVESSTLGGPVLMGTKVQSSNVESDVKVRHVLVIP